MAKKQKFKNIKLEHQELSPTTIGAFENRKKSSFGTFLILSIFILVIVFLPEISNLVDAYLNPVVNVPGGNVGPKPNPTEPPDNEENNYSNEFYPISADLVIKRDDITVSNISLDSSSNVLAFQVTNVTQGNLILEDLNYYMELYNDGTLLERVKITGSDSVAINYPISYQKKLSSITNNLPDSIVLVKKSVEDYPILKINVDENNQGSLVCKSSDETVTYKFTNNELKELTSEVKHLVSEVDYYTGFTENKNKATTYNSKSGIVSSFIDYNEGYTITTNVNLNEANRQYIYNADTFKLNTEPKVVKFEMEAQGFICN